MPTADESFGKRIEAAEQMIAAAKRETRATLIFRGLTIAALALSLGQLLAASGRATRRPLSPGDAEAARRAFGEASSRFDRLRRRG